MPPSRSACSSSPAHTSADPESRRQTASAGVIFGASLVGGPVSTTQVVASSVVGIGVGRRRWHHVHWAVVRQMGLAWLVTMPVTAALAVIALGFWTLVA